MDSATLDALATRLTLNAAERAELQALIRPPTYPWWIIPMSILGLFYLALGYNSMIALWSLPKGAPSFMWPHPRGVSDFWQGTFWLLFGLFSFATYRRDRRRKALVERLVGALQPSSTPTA